jgi:hypothetical protein
MKIDKKLSEEFGVPLPPPVWLPLDLGGLPIGLAAAALSMLIAGHPWYAFYLVIAAGVSLLASIILGLVMAVILDRNVIGD